MNSREKALINYYARLIQKETYNLEDVPESLRPRVKQVVEALVAKENEESKQ